jgi:hypothetical protein
MVDTFPSLKKSLREQLDVVEGSLNRLYGIMSPQLEMNLEWHRTRILELIIEQQIKEFDRCDLPSC